MTNISIELLLIVITLLAAMLLIGAGVKYAARVKANEELWKFALEGAGDGVWDWDIIKDVAHLSPRYKEIFGFSDEDIVTNHKAWSSRVHPDDLASMTQTIIDYLDGKTDKYVHEHRIICKDKSIKWVLSRGMIVKRDQFGKATRMVGTHTDITTRKELEEKLNSLAHYDALSGLPNRTLFSDRLRQALSYAKRNKTSLAVMFIDLDLFKEINDKHGHETGDKVLKRIASRMTKCIRESDTVARLGGDEFVILLATIDDEPGAMQVANKLVECIGQPIKLNEHTVQVTSSIGIALYPQHGHDDKLLVINADLAMYQAKRMGKNQAHIFDPTMVEATQ